MLSIFSTRDEKQNSFYKKTLYTDVHDVLLIAMCLLVVVKMIFFGF